MAVLDVQNLTLAFGENTLFKGVSFDVKEKEKVGLIGCNGAGKTSLLKIIKGDYEPDEGACFVSKNAKLGYMEQHTCSENRSVWEELVSVFEELIRIEKEIEELSVKLEKAAPLKMKTSSVLTILPTALILTADLPIKV